jgi:ribulose-phosphate 3-epimerase
MSAIICPTITAYDDATYSKQIENVKSFATRIHIDLMDGVFAPTKSVGLDKVWWPDNLQADIHLMFKNPNNEIDNLIRLKPNLVVIHIEADVSHQDFSEKLNENGIKTGIALLHDTPLESINSVARYYEHILIFSGHLGYHGGEADLNILSKVRNVCILYPEKEISWDGGINDVNAKQIVEAGVSVLNVGGYIQANSNPQEAYAKLETSL